MSKKSFERYKKKRRQGKDKPASSSPKRKSGGSIDKWLFLLKNTFGGLIFFFLLVMMVKNINGYSWFFKNLVSNNLRIIKKYSHLSSDKKWEAKLKFPAKFCLQMKENLPDSAVILFPFDSTHLEDPPDLDHVKDVKGSFMRKPFVTYFLYPRKVVYQYEKGKNPLYEKATHLAIVDKIGYDLVGIDRKGQPKYTVVPLDNVKLK